jgi:hypothetical protein
MNKKIQSYASLALMVCMGSANALTGNMFQVTSSGTPATIPIELCLSAGSSKPNSQSGCETFTATGTTLGIRLINLNAWQSVRLSACRTYTNVGIKPLTSSYALATGATLNPATGYYSFSANCGATTTVTLSSTSAPTLTSASPNIGSASGGLGVTLSGFGLSGATDVTFDGIAATSVNVVNSTTVTAVTPAHAAGAVNVVVTTPSGTATLVSGFTYQATAVGQSAYGGKIACLNGGLNNLIAATADNSSGIVWGGTGTTTTATSTTNGAANTSAIVNALGINGGTPYAAKLCSDYEVDSQSNSPCQTGNTCYNDWFLPAGNNALTSGQLSCLYTNRVAIGGFSSVGYWSSTEDSANNAWYQSFSNGVQSNAFKSDTLRVRCVRAFTP